MKWVMKRAHELARNMEGDYTARLVISLRQAWKEAKKKKVKEVRLALNHQPSGGKEWIARITGTHSKYGLARKFLKVEERDWSYSGRTGTTYYSLSEGGLYEINEPWKERRFVKVEAGEVIEISATEAKEMAEKMEECGK